MLIALWKRPEITKVCFKGVKRLMKSFDIEPICIYSDEENKVLCDQFGFESYEYPNDHLGAKLNYGIEKALESEWDYLTQIGSDNLVKEEIFELYKPYFEKEQQCFGIGEVYYYDVKTDRVAFVENAFPYGCMRMIHRDALLSHKMAKVIFKSSCEGKSKLW